VAIGAHPALPAPGMLLLGRATECSPVIIQHNRASEPLASEAARASPLLVEQNFRFASTVADRYYVMEHGASSTQFANASFEA